MRFTSSALASGPRGLGTGCGAAAGGWGRGAATGCGGCGAGWGLGAAGLPFASARFAARPPPLAACFSRRCFTKSLKELICTLLLPGCHHGDHRPLAWFEVGLAQILSSR